MKSKLTTAQEFVEAIHWEGVRAHWFTRQNRFREVEEASTLAHELQMRLDRLGGRG
jgi:hypothetical protein